jgi:hypothetical protein
VSADRRQHVRFWLALASGAEGSPVWLGSATFDKGVTLSRDTGQVTHKIAPNVDEERDQLVGGLNREKPQKTGVSAFHAPRVRKSETLFFKGFSRGESGGSNSKLAEREGCELGPAVAGARMFHNNGIGETGVYAQS